MLFEVDICIIRLGCVIVSGLPHQRVLQRREGAVQPNNGRLPSSHYPTSPAPASHPATHPCCRSAASQFYAWTRKGKRESERKVRGEEEGFECVMGVGGQGVELRYLNMQSVNWL